ncbi:MAG: alanine racemase [Gemmatimonadales bacterium]
MSISRRTFVAGATALGLAKVRTGSSSSRVIPSSDRFDPWIEIDPAALRHNVREVARLVGNRPILAVVKNNAYGLGLSTVCPVLDTMSEIAGFAVVKSSAAIELRELGIRKPILLMGMFAQSDSGELAAHNISISLYTDDAGTLVGRMAQQTGRPVDAHLYLDTGMGRMGMAYHRADEWIKDLAARDDLSIAGIFMAFTEETDFDREQLERLGGVVSRARESGVRLGQVHAASSNAVFHLPEAHLDMVRPGIALYGAYPSEPATEARMSTLHPAFRLKARVVRVEQLRPGDSVSYGRKYIAERPTWIATVPVGHSDGYSRRAVEGARVLIGSSLYPVVGAVSASHAILEVGNEKKVSVGDVATLVGPDRPEIKPNAVADAIGISVYDVLMHMNPGLPKAVVSGK